MTQRQLVPRVDDALLAGGETEVLPVPVRGELGKQDPGSRNHHQGLTETPGTLDKRREEDSAYSPQQQPKDKKGEQHMGSKGCRAPPKQANA